MLTARSIRDSLGLALLLAIAAAAAQLTAEQDHRRLMGLLHITSLRQGADGRNPQAPNAANYDESKANPYPKLPDPLLLKNGEKVTTPKIWWRQRRPEIVEDFDREIYGRVPSHMPKTSAVIGSVASPLSGASTAPTILAVLTMTVLLPPASACATASTMALRRARLSSGTAC